MRHCCKFLPREIYFLSDNANSTNRKLSVGICPICEKQVAEYSETTFDGKINLVSKTGLKADKLVSDLKNEISYAASECNYRRCVSKPFGWKYGVNKITNNKDKEIVKQYAYDFYGNKELVKTI